jgi:undecaprenyl diphosphate synthase
MRHLAIIMDGNGRWAKARRLPRLMGHKAGADALDRTMRLCKAAGIEYLTVYAFSTENWKRSEEEVSGLMKLLSSFIKSKADELVREGVRFRVIGRRADLSSGLQEEIAGLEEKTRGGKFTLVVALSYGSRDEIVRAAVRFADKLKDRESASEELFASCLDTADIPDPDLIVRTSGEIRLSNFLMWQAAYSEFYFTDVLWPDFDQAEFDKALASYGTRERRMGGRLK